MDYKEKRTNKIVITTKCLDKKFKCLSFPETNHIFSMPEKTHEIYSLNQRIYELTTELWNNILTIIHKEEFYYEEGVCYDILNPKNCEDLNFHYHNFNENLILYQQRYFDKAENGNHFLLLEELSNSLFIFLNSPLFSLGNNIKHLIIRIQKPDMSNEKESYIELSTEREVDDKLNKFLIVYLQLLSDLLDKFNLTYDSLELNDLKEVIKDRINTIKTQKKEYLERLDLYNAILYPLTSTYSDLTTHISDDHGITSSIITEQTIILTQTDNETSTSGNSYDTTNYSTEQPLKVFDNLETTQSFFFSGNNYEDGLQVNNSTEHNLNECLTSKDKWIVFGSMFSILFFIAIGGIMLAVFVIKKYKSKNNNLKNTESIQLESEPFYSVPIYTN